MLANFTKTLNVYLRSLNILKNNPDDLNIKKRHVRNKETLKMFINNYKPLRKAFSDLNIEEFENI